MTADRPDADPPVTTIFSRSIPLEIAFPEIAASEIASPEIASPEIASPEIAAGVAPIAPSREFPAGVPAAPAAIAPLRNPPRYAVFVYGTLKPGETNYRRCCAGFAVAARPAIAPGALFHLPEEGYPALTAGDRPVWGYVLGFDSDALLARLDRLEGFCPDGPPAANAYQRQRSPVADPEGRDCGTVWIYRMTPERVAARGGQPLPSGWWPGLRDRPAWAAEVPGAAVSAWLRGAIGRDR